MVSTFYSTFRTGDFVPPSITSVIPPIEGTAQITINFSEPMDTASIRNPGNYIFSCSNDCPITAIVGISSPDSISAVLTLSNSYRCYMVYDLTVKKSVTDIAGNQMTSDYPWTYQLGCPQ